LSEGTGDKGIPVRTGNISFIKLTRGVKVMSEHCQICGKKYGYVYEVTNELWEKITGIKNGSGLRCIPCLEKLAKSKGINLRWHGWEVEQRSIR